MKIVNQGIKKVDGIGVITGRPVYTDDLSINNNPLIIKILRSPHASAKIININKSIAEKIPGVECILTHEDVPMTKFTLAGQSYPEPSPYDRRILDEYVRYVGDEVAIIAAVDEKTAAKAMKLIKVEYNILDAVLDYEDAVDNPILVHREELHQNFDIGMERERNIASSYVIEDGDVEKAFRDSDVIVEETYYTQPQIHAMMETYRTSTYLDANGRLCVISSTQIPFHVRRHLARALEIPRNKIRVIKPRIGGGFGGKQTAATEIFPAIVTLKTGKPAKLIYNRRETHTCTTSRHGMRLKVKMGSDLEGNIKGFSIDILSNTGAYGEHAPTVTKLVAFKTSPLYDRAAVRYDAKIVYTNTMPAGAFRGYGATQGAFAVESAINELAKKLGMDPTVIREKNLVEPAPEKYIVSGDIKKCVEKGKEIFGWNEKYPARVTEDGKIRAAGMAVTMQGSGIAGLDTAAATIKLWDDGTYTLFIGVTDMGQGSDTVLTQMAAEVLECSVDKIVLNSADTDVSPYDPGAYASSGTYVTGNAVIIAANKMRAEIINGTSEILGVSKDEISFDGENVESEAGEKISLDELANRLISFEGKNQITVTGTWGGEKSPPPFIAGFTEVEVDPATGEVEVIEFLSVVDCGLPINPNLARVQVEGGTAQGIGLALYEDIQYDSKGRVKNDTFMQYKIPCRKDIKKIGVEFVYSNEPTGPFGAKSIGEVVVNTPAPAIADAVYNATGVRIRKLPINAEKILLGMMEKI
ncbi:molybdopterin cofactor-binding domain-containing protein [uncultured Ilyobacter sp.]|uniref:xanthine dehydrogenase family protein molybdopterin-binding subunit n=1 Tax=uncultured Ilyobacter sp. TaxID=544433 RepID=UPI0029C6C7FA|nr:molybdopterin cofactor-binding domain-containing protein [uncultured Ilyobacter sp.]